MPQERAANSAHTIIKQSKISCFYLTPDLISAPNIFVALVIGAASGLTATGANQIIKQLGKGEESGK